MKTEWKTSYTKRDRTTSPDHKYLKENYTEEGFKSAAAFLEHIIEEYRKPNLFKRKK